MVSILQSETGDSRARPRYVRIPDKSSRESCPSAHVAVSPHPLRLSARTELFGFRGIDLAVHQLRGPAHRPRTVLFRALPAAPVRGRRGSPPGLGVPPGLGAPRTAPLGTADAPADGYVA